MALTPSQKGRLAETLVGAYCVLGSNGVLNVSTPFVDDEGIDLIFNLKGGSRNLALQVKSRFTLTPSRGQFRTQVGKKTLVPRDELYLLFVSIDEKNCAIGDNLWFVLSTSFVCEVRRQRKTRPDYVFDSNFGAENDMWRKYRISKAELPQAIISAIRNLR